MQVCRTLTVHGTPGSLRGFFEEIRQRRPGGWRHDAALSPEISIFQRTPGGCPGDHMVIFGYMEATTLMAANVHTTPDWPGDFTMDLFNEILCHFADAIRPHASKWGLSVAVGDDQGEMGAMMQPPTFTALKQFAAARGQADSLSDMCWSRFLTLAHMERCLVRPPELAEWLRLQGWPQADCEYWARELTRGLTLLDARETMADQVKVIHLEDLPAASAHVN